MGSNKGKWIKAAAFAVIIIAVVLLLTGCSTKTGNRVVSGWDVQTFTYAYIYLGGQELVKGYITQWRDYDNSDTIQVMIDGKYYLTHYTNVVMIADPSHGSLQHSDSSLFGVKE